MFGFRLSKVLTTLFTTLAVSWASAQSLDSDTTNLTIYLIPGQGSDYRIFNKLQLSGDYMLKDITYSVPEEGVSLPEYARLLAKQIDTSKPFALVGVSLGGMVATEMTDFLHPETVIVISSAKCKQELPGRYRFQEIVPIYKWFSGDFYKAASFIAQPIVEPDRKKEEDTFVKMLKAKDPLFLKRATAMIMQWERTTYNPDIIHIHGDNDHTIPIENVNWDYKIKGGSHMMTLVMAKYINAILEVELGSCE